MDVNSSASSFDTCYSPSTAVLTLTPYNDEARLEFSKVVEWLQEQKEGVADSVRDHARKYMYISSEQVQDSGVAKVIRRRETGTLSSSPASSPVSQPLSAPAVETVPVLNGFYYLDFGEPPRCPARGWVAGRLRHGQHPIDLVLCLSKDQQVMVRQTHALFQLSDLSSMTVRSAHRMSAINDELLSDRRGPYYLQDVTSTLTLGYLKYRVAYSHFSRSEHYRVLERGRLFTS